MKTITWWSSYDVASRDEATRKLAAVSLCHLPVLGPKDLTHNGYPLSRIRLATGASGALASTF